ncbi:hypothetical protein CORC01_11048 [Colletotrichum orchidophilum]|uniref:Uncharacterized protein n=1 Tax=Colletotrichum orchidophilum TaxID=1209926 RepID=A0A1G4AX06_9PEZI|nr:uncharacterized protein CORC01_11048 [Colletotrichum orchidophilum]OHE93645.1 hypothetical protein CORC01_11048 [Colletotrichum orchidophilum]
MAPRNKALTGEFVLKSKSGRPVKQDGWIERAMKAFECDVNKIIWSESLRVEILEALKKPTTAQTLNFTNTNEHEAVKESKKISRSINELDLWLWLFKVPADKRARWTTEKVDRFAAVLDMVEANPNPNQERWNHIETLWEKSRGRALSIRERSKNPEQQHNFYLEESCLLFNHLLLNRLLLNRLLLNRLPLNRLLLNRLLLRHLLLNHLLLNRLLLNRLLLNRLLLRHLLLNRLLLNCLPLYRLFLRHLLLIRLLLNRLLSIPTTSNRMCLEDTLKNYENDDVNSIGGLRASSNQQEVGSYDSRHKWDNRPTDNLQLSDNRRATNVSPTPDRNSSKRKWSEPGMTETNQEPSSARLQDSSQRDAKRQVTSAMEYYLTKSKKDQSIHQKQTEETRADQRSRFFKRVADIETVAPEAKQYLINETVLRMLQHATGADPNEYLNQTLEANRQHFRGTRDGGEDDDD